MDSLYKRFYSKVDRVEGPDACWPWRATRISEGYGQFWQDGRYRPATHVALELDGRPVPKGMFACHHCDNPPCVRPTHLFLGTNSDNVRDSQAKGRSRWDRATPEDRALHGAVMSAVMRGLERTHCKHGHALTPDNIRQNPRGIRRCLTCHREDSRMRRAHGKEVSR